MFLLNPSNLNTVLLVMEPSVLREIPNVYVLIRPLIQCLSLGVDGCFPPP